MWGPSFETPAFGGLLRMRSECVEEVFIRFLQLLALTPAAAVSKTGRGRGR